MKCNDGCILATIAMLCITVMIVAAVYTKHIQKMEEYKLIELNCTKLIGAKDE